MCIMNSEYEIFLWDTFNVLDFDDFRCKGEFKNGKVCDRKCSLKFEKEGKMIYTCQSHFTKEQPKTKANEFKKKNMNDYLLQDIAKLFIQRVEEIYQKNIDVFQQLDSILIELQPKLNPKAVFTSHILYGKLVEIYKNTDVIIKFVRASQKLKAYTGPEIKCELKGKYAQRKWLSIQYCQWFLENKFSEEQKQKWLPIFKEHSKKDDMSDTALMCINGISKKK